MSLFRDRKLVADKFLCTQSRITGIFFITIRRKSRRLCRRNNRYRDDCDSSAGNCQREGGGGRGRMPSGLPSPGRESLSRDTRSHRHSFRCELTSNNNIIINIIIFLCIRWRSAEYGALPGSTLPRIFSYFYRQVLHEIFIGSLPEPPLGSLTVLPAPPVSL